MKAGVLTETAKKAESGQLQFWFEPSERAIFQTFWKVKFVYSEKATLDLRNLHSTFD